MDAYNSLNIVKIHKKKYHHEPPIQIIKQLFPDPLPDIVKETSLDCKEKDEDQTSILPFASPLKKPKQVYNQQKTPDLEFMEFVENLLYNKIHSLQILNTDNLAILIRETEYQKALLLKKIEIYNIFLKHGIVTHQHKKTSNECLDQPSISENEDLVENCKKIFTNFEQKAVTDIFCGQQAPAMNMYNIRKSMSSKMRHLHLVTPSDSMVHTGKQRHSKDSSGLSMNYNISKGSSQIPNDIEF